MGARRGISRALVWWATLDRARKRVVSLIALGVVVGAFVVLFTVFYAAKISGCSFCGYINCVDLLEDFCANHGQASTEPLYIDFP